MFCWDVVSVPIWGENNVNEGMFVTEKGLTPSHIVPSRIGRTAEINDKLV